MRGLALLSLTALLLVAAPAHARVIAVRATGSGDAIAEAIRDARPGDEVRIQPGVYEGSVWIDRSGAPGRPIVVRPAAGNFSVVLRGGGETLSIGDGAHDLVIQGLEVRESGDNLVHVQGGAHDIVLRDLRVHDAGEDGDGVKVNQARDIVIERVECFHPGPRPGSPDGNPAQECVDLLDVERVVVQDSFLHDGGNMLLYAKGGSRDVVFQRNVIVGQGPRAVDPCVGVGAVSDRELLRGRAYEAFDVVLRNNVVAGCPGGAVGVYDARGAWVVNNTFVDDGPEVVQFRAGNAPREESRDVHVLNNVLTDPGGGMRAAYVQRSHGLADLEVRNNLYWNGARPVPSEGLLDPGAEPGALRADPGLAAVPAGVRSSAEILRRMAPGPAARDHAVALAGPGAVADDASGNARGSVGATDLGALEAGATTRSPAQAVGHWPSGVTARDPVVPVPLARGGGPASRSGCAHGCAAGRLGAPLAAVFALAAALALRASRPR